MANHNRILLLAFIILFGCSGNHLSAKWAAMQGENFFIKAYEMRYQPGKRGERIRLYKKSCDHFMKAYTQDAAVFTLNRIESAITACAWAENHEAKAALREFEIEYMESHPTETTYGDAMPLGVE